MEQQRSTPWYVRLSYGGGAWCAQRCPGDVRAARRERPACTPLSVSFGALFSGEKSKGAQSGAQQRFQRRAAASNASSCPAKTTRRSVAAIHEEPNDYQKKSWACASNRMAGQGKLVSTQQGRKTKGARCLMSKQSLGGLRRG